MSILVNIMSYGKDIESPLFFAQSSKIIRTKSKNLSHKKEKSHNQICSECGYKNPEVKDFRVRNWKCPQCGAEHDRDRNATINILRVGASTLRGDEVILFLYLNSINYP